MGAYSLDTLVRKWTRGELTVEQMVGQILLHLQDLQNAVAGLERRVYPSTSSGQGHWPPEAEDDGEENGS